MPSWELLYHARPACPSPEASNGVLSGAVLYYNWVEPRGHTRSMRRTFVSAMPWYVPCRGCIIDGLITERRKQFQVEAAGRMHVAHDAAAPEREPEVRALLVRELEHFQSKLVEFGGDYLLGAEPSAADFSVYAQVERLVGDMGDAKLFAALPELLDAPQLKVLWGWHSRMRERHPLKYRGKRDPRARAAR